MNLRLVQVLRSCPIYFILDKSICGEKDPVEMGKQALAAGVRVMQLRLKGLPVNELVAVAGGLKASWTEPDWILIVNDSVEAALAGGADGVHLGLEDMPVADAREVGPSLIIGATARIARDAMAAEDAGADYLGCGSVFPSQTKPGLPVIGLSGLSAIAVSVGIPVVGIGGITSGNARQVLAAGAAGFCSVAPFAGGLSVTQMAREIIASAEGKGDSGDGY
jgi:thiamine-phosphate diphosphorylase